MLFVTNSQLHSETLQRVTTQPEILLTASDQAAGPAGAPFNGTVRRNIVFDTTRVLNGLRGPGVINSPVALDYNKVGTSFWNGLFPDTNSFAFPSAVNELTQMPSTAWASFDGTTNDPIVYPNGISIRNLENLVLIQITPASLPNGTNGVPYPPVTFTTTGGAFTPPFTWSAAGLPAVPTSGLPPGMAVSSAGTLSGTPAASGTFDFLLQMTDRNSRSVQWFYSIIIQSSP